MELDRALLVLLDISGYTAFVRQRQMSLLHAEEIITALLTSVTEQATHPLELNKFEGDAAFLFLKLGADATAAGHDVMRQVSGFFTAFAQERARLSAERQPQCDCEACQQIDMLTLKAVVHVGDVVFKQVQQFDELGGEAVILVHRLLKNTLPTNTYVLVTETAFELTGRYAGVMPAGLPIRGKNRSTILALCQWLRSMIRQRRNRPVGATACVNGCASDHEPPFRSCLSTPNDPTDPPPSPPVTHRLRLHPKVPMLQSRALWPPPTMGGTQGAPLRHPATNAAPVGLSMSLLLILKLAVVVFFLVMFLRGARLVWGIGLLTVTTAFLLDAFLGTFGVTSMQEQLGFFFYVIAGGLIAGAALWLWGLLRPDTVVAAPRSGTAIPSFTPAAPRDPATPINQDAYAGTAFDRRMMYDQVRYRFSPDDVMDLVFDLRLNENDMVHPGRPMSDTIINVMDAAEESNKTTELALAVERILTPPPPDHLPRLERLTVDSPPTVLRHFLLANYTLAELRRMATQLTVDWEQLGSGNKKELVRNFLLHLDRRNRLAELVAVMKGEELPQPAGE